MRSMRRLIPLFVLAANAIIATSAYACPFCKDSLARTDAETVNAVPAGFNNTIYLMLFTFLCVISMVTFTLVKGARSSANAGSASRSPRGFPLE